MTENQGTKILLADGTEYEIQYSGTFFVCTICGEEYGNEPAWGYCDETINCAFDDGESLIVLPGYVPQD
jgi:hypothetical protein